jgi:hypothetical protein
MGFSGQLLANKFTGMKEKNKNVAIKNTDANRVAILYPLEYSFLGTYSRAAFN